MRSCSVVEAGPEVLPEEEGGKKKEKEKKKMEAGRANPSSCCLFGAPTKPSVL